MKRPWAKLSGACFIGMVVLAVVAGFSGGFVEANKWNFFGGILLCYACIGFFVVHLIQTAPERKKWLEEHRAQRQTETEKHRAAQPRAVYAVYIGDTTKMALKQIFGLALLGRLGVLIGMYRGMNPSKVAFEVTYDNGRTAVEIVKVKSERYHQLMSLTDEVW